MTGISTFIDDVDINEALPDWIKLNTKRKELLLEFSNIFPYTGAYKALINILKYFGYDQVTLKEYWLKVLKEFDTNKHQLKICLALILKQRKDPVECFLINYLRRLVNLVYSTI